MKHTFAGIALATMTLGTVVPAAFASTAAASTITYKQEKKTIQANGTTLSQPYAFVASDGSNPTTYMPIWYVGKALEAAGFTQSWNGNSQVWSLGTTTKTNFSSIAVGSGNASISVNGQIVKKVNTHVAKDPAAGANAQETTYMPIYYIDEIFQAAGIDFNWDGNTWVVKNSYKSGIAGFVTDGNAPLKGVTVTVAGKTAVTDVNGYYSIDDLAPGQYTVNFSDVGYTSTSVSNVNVTKDNGSTVGAELTALDKSQISLSSIAVNSVTGAPVANADVKVEALNKTTNKWSTVATTMTGTDGKFSIGNGSSSANGALAFGGDYRVTVGEDYNKADATNTTATYAPYTNLQSAFGESQRTITLAADSNSNPLSGFELQPVAPTNISGSVKDSSGNESTTAVVKLLDTDGKTVLAQQTATASGYSFSGLTLPSGKYTLLVNDKTNAISTNTITVVAGQSVSDNIQLQAGHSVTLTLGTVALGGQFAVGTYNLQIVNANGVVVNSTSYDVANTAVSEIPFSALTQIPDGNYTLVVSGQFVQTTKIPVAVSGADVPGAQGRASTAGAVKGTITGAANTEAQVELKDASGAVVASGNTDASGNYEFDGLTPGNYTVTASEDGYATQATPTLAVADGQMLTANTSLTLVALPTTAAVSGYVREASSLNPLDGSVTFYTVSEDGTGAASTVQPVSATVTAGSYQVPSLAPGTYNVVVRAAGHENYVSTLTVAAGDSLTNQNFTLAKGGNAALNVTVKDSQGNVVSPDTISLTDAYGAQAAQTSGKTAFANLSGGSYTLNITKADDVTVAQPVVLTTGETDNLTVTLQAVAAAHQVNIRVLDQTDADVNNAKVVAFDANGNEVALATTTTTGAASLSLQDGAYTLKVFSNGYIVSQASITVSGQDVTVPALLLQKY